MIENYLLHLRATLRVLKRLIHLKLNVKQDLKQALSAKKKKKILIATSVSENLACSYFEAALGRALSARGNDVDYLYCDGSLPACMAMEASKVIKFNNNIKAYKQNLCATCRLTTKHLTKSLPKEKVHLYGDYLNDNEKNEVGSKIRKASEKVDPSEHARAGFLRFVAKGSITPDEPNLYLYDSYLHAAEQASSVYRNLSFSKQYDVVVMNHGIYVPQGLLLQNAKQNGSRVVTWTKSYRKNTFLFSHDDTYHHAMQNDCSWENFVFTEAQKDKLLDYLKSRKYGSNDWISFNKNIEENAVDFLKARGFSSKKFTIFMPTNVMWDAQLHFPKNAFDSLWDWVETTIELISIREEFQLIIRIHPAEINGNIVSQQRLSDLIDERFPDLADNIFVINSSDNVSSYELADLCDLAVIYGTKMGFELAAMGKRVLVAGDAWVRNKGFTIDVTSPEQYKNIMQFPNKIAPMAPEEIFNAQKYAYYLFFRRMIEIDSLDLCSSWPGYRAQFKNIHDPGLNRILSAIEEGTPFVMD